MDLGGLADSSTPYGSVVPGTTGKSRRSRAYILTHADMPTTTTHHTPHTIQQAGRDHRIQWTGTLNPALSLLV